MPVGDSQRQVSSWHTTPPRRRRSARPLSISSGLVEQLEPRWLIDCLPDSGKPCPAAWDDSEWSVPTAAGSACVMDALGLQLSNIAQPAKQRALRMEGDGIIVPLASMFPPRSSPGG